MTARLSLLTAAVVATLGVATMSHAGMIIAGYEEASGTTGLFGTSSSGELTGGRFIGPPSSQFSPVGIGVRGQPDFLDPGVLFSDGLEASIVAFTDTGYEGTLTVFVIYFDTLAAPGTLNLRFDFEVGILAPGWTLSVEDYGDPSDSPFIVTTMLLGSEVFTTPGSAIDVATLNNPGGYFSLTTIFRITAPGSGTLTATARIVCRARVATTAAATPLPETSPTVTTQSWFATSKTS